MKKLELDIQRFASGTISGGTYNARYSYFMTWTSTSNGSVANTSNVTLNWVFKKTASDSYNAYNSSGSSKVTLVINGNSSGAVRADFDLRSASVGTEKVIATYTVNNIPHNADGTCTINVSGSHNTGLNWGTFSIGSTAITLDTIPRYASCSQSLNSSSSTETSLVINWSSDSTIDYVWYSKDGGSNWTAVGSVNASSGSYTISSLSVGTSYSIKTRVRRKDSQLTTDSSANSWATYSYPYISSVGTSALTIGGTQTLSLYNPKSRSVTVYMKKDSTSGTQFYSGSTSSTSIQFTPTASTMYSSIPNAKSGNCVYYCVYSGNTSATKSGTYVVNESDNKPTVTSETPYDNNSTTYGLTNNRAKIVLNASNMQLTIVANAKNSATFNNGGYIKVNGTSLSLTISGSNATGVYTLNKPTSASYTITLRDSRGIDNTISYTIPSYVNYFAPTINTTAVRNQPTDNKINITGSGTFFNASFGSQSNTLTATYTVKETSTSTTLATGSMTVTKNGNNHSEAQVQVSNADYTKNYTVQITVTDKLNSQSSNVAVPKGEPIFNWDNDEFDINVDANFKSVNSLKTKSDAGFEWDNYGNWKHRRNTSGDTWSIKNNAGTNKFTVQQETGNVTVAGTLTVGSKTLLDLTYPVGSIYMSVNSTSPATLFGGTWTQLQDRFLIGTSSTYSNGSTGGSTTFNNYHKHTTGGHTLTIDEIPAHNHGFNGIANKQGSSGSSYYFVQYNEGGDNQLYINNRGGGGSHSHGDTGYAGSSTQSIMPPYLAVYMWKRTA